jgi:hypothetical protein
MHLQSRKVLVTLTAFLVMASSWMPILAQDAEEIRVRQGQQRSGDRGRIKIRLTSVLEDSRCPVGATCVWAGNARVKLEVTRGRSRRTIELSTTLEPKVVSALGYSFRLVDLKPLPGEKVKMRPVATVSVTKNRQP